MDAPRTLDGWYQITDLQKFNSGADAADMHGRQMAPIAAVLADDEAMRDVVAYIQSLR